MTHPNKQKGNRTEREVVKLHEDFNHIKAQRVPLSGAVEEYPGDIEVFFDRADDPRKEPGHKFQLRGEVKCRKGGSGFKVLEGWLGTNDLLYLKRDRQDYLVVLKEEVYLNLLKIIDKQQ